MPYLSAARLTLVVLALAAASAPAAQANYAIPLDNPFASAAGARPEVYVYGMRNPFRWSFDRLTGDMWIGDVGGIQEEITHLPRARAAGANLGWNCRSGTATQSSCTPANHFVPAHTYPSGPDVVIGGFVVRDPTLPGFAGRYLFGRINSGIYRLEANGTATRTAADVVAVSGFGEDAAGRLYVASLAGPVYRLGQAGAALTRTSIGNFDEPVALAGVPGDAERLFVVEQEGRVKLRASGQVGDFLDITGLVGRAGGEEGLLAFAAAPDYATSGRVFAYYTDNSGDLQLDEFRRTATGPDRSEVSTRRPLLTIQHDPADNHNGGQLLFGPDGHLYLSTGDGGGQGDVNGDAQNLGSLLGKILRFDVGTGGDGLAPKLRAKASRRQRVLKLGGALAYVRCSEACAVAAGGRLRIGKREYRMRRAGKLTPPHRRARVKVLLGRKGRVALKRALRRRQTARVVVNLRARDATGNRSPLARRTVRVTR